MEKSLKRGQDHGWRPEKLEQLQAGSDDDLHQMKVTEVVGSGQTQGIFCKQRQHDVTMV